jgi:hypothetical protein
MDGVGIEKFAEFCHIVAEAYVDELTDGRCRCVKVEVFEHENNSAIYTSHQTQRISFTEDKKLVETTTSNTKQNPTDLTKPPFVKNKPASVGNSKVTNKWIDPKNNNTWGL